MKLVSSWGYLTDGCDLNAYMNLRKHNVCEQGFVPYFTAILIEFFQPALRHFAHDKFHPRGPKIPSGISASWPKWTGLHPLMWPFTDIPATPASNRVTDTLWSGEELSAMVISSNRVCQFGKTLRLLMLAVLSFTVCCQNILGAFAKFWPVTLATTRIFLAQTNLCLTLRL